MSKANPTQAMKQIIHKVRFIFCGSTPGDAVPFVMGGIQSTFPPREKNQAGPPPRFLLPFALRSCRTPPIHYIAPMFDWFSDPSAWAALLTLTLLEIVLGIDNIVFISMAFSLTVEMLNLKLRPATAAAP